MNPRHPPRGPRIRDARPDRASGRVGAALLALCLLLSPTVSAADGEDLLQALKVAYLYNFTRFIQWPQKAPERPFIICAIGDPAMATRLRALEHEGKRVDGRPIVIRGLDQPGLLGDCDILFVGADAEDRLDLIVRRTASQPTLLVADTPGFAGRGVAIELYRKPDIFGKTERLRLRIDPTALKGRGLTVSAQLYDVAEVIR